MFRLPRVRRLGPLAVLPVIAATVIALTATNTIAGSRAGDGSAAVSGYVVTNIHYTLNAANPASVDAVRFDLDAAATAVRARVNAGAWSTCVNTVATTWSCPLVAITALAAANLQIVAVS